MARMTLGGKLERFIRQQTLHETLLKEARKKTRAQERADRRRVEKNVGFSQMAELDALPKAQRHELAELIRKLLEKHITSPQEKAFLRIKGLAFHQEPAEPDLTKEARRG